MKIRGLTEPDVAIKTLIRCSRPPVLWQFSIREHRQLAEALPVRAARLTFALSRNRHRSAKLCGGVLSTYAKRRAKKKGRPSDEPLERPWGKEDKMLCADILTRAQR